MSWPVKSCKSGDIMMSDSACELVLQPAWVALMNDRVCAVKEFCWPDGGSR
jgi:hypothetical protein